MGSTSSPRSGRKGKTTRSCCSPASSTTPAKAIRASGPGLRIRSARNTGAWIWRVAGAIPGFRGALTRLQDHAEESGAARGGGGLHASDGGADPLPGRATGRRGRRAAAPGGRGELMTSEAASPITRTSVAFGEGRRPEATVTHVQLPDFAGPLGPPPGIDRGAPARRLDRAARRPRRGLPRCPRLARRRPPRQRELVRRRREPAHPHQEPGDAAAPRRAAGRRCCRRRSQIPRPSCAPDSFSTAPTGTPGRNSSTRQSSGAGSSGANQRPRQRPDSRARDQATHHRSARSSSSRRSMALPGSPSRRSRRPRSSLAQSR